MQKLNLEKKLVQVCCVLFILFGSTTNILYGSNQCVPKKNITLDFKDVELSVVLKEIETQSGLSFFFSNEKIDVTKKVSIKAVNEDLESVLEKLFGKGFSFSEKDNYIVINKAEPSKPEKIRRFIRGVVTDEDSDPLPGVSVVVKGTYIGVPTNDNGKFILDYTANSDIEPILVFTSIGFQSQEANFDGKPALTITLQKEEVKLNELIVTGYANIEKKNFTGSAITVEREELLKSSPRNVIESLQLFDPSFKILENNEMGSDPNTMPQIYVRGQSGIGTTEITESGDLSEQNLRNNPNLPTFIMDGFEVSVERLYDLDPTRIKSITILKDAASTAIYGSRAANGVIVIETVKPKEGQLRVNYSFNGSVTVPDLTDYDLLDAREKVELEKMAGAFEPDEDMNPSEALKLDRSYYDKMMQVNRGVNTYWLSKPLHTPLNQKHNILLEGGSKEFIFGLDLKSARTNGAMKGSERNNNSLGFSVTYRKNKIQFRNYIEWNNLKSQESPYGTFSTYTLLNPYDTYLDDDGNYVKKLQQWKWKSNNRATPKNPLYDATLNSYNTTVQNEFTNNFHFNWFITKNLKLDSRIAISNSRREQQVFKDPASSIYESETDFLQKGQKSVYNTSSTSIDANAFLLYAKSIKQHQVNFNIGGNVREVDKYATSFTLIGFPSGLTDDISFAADIKNKPQGLSDVTRTVGFFGSLNYTFNNIYLLDISGRYDGASQFGNNAKFAPFWSAGAGINIHNYQKVKESFPWINFFKVRTNYGQLGKANFSQSLSKSTYNYNFEIWYLDGIGATMQTLGNPDLEWEKTRMFDAGFDLTVFSKLSVAASYYNKNTVDLIGDITLPLSSGFSSYKSNLGEILNEGFELNARVNAINKKDFNLFFYGTASHNTNKFVKIYGALEEYNQLVEEYYKDHKTVNKPLNKYYEGASQTAIYAMQSLGINPADGKEIYLNSKGETTYDWSASELVVVGDTEPTLRGALGFNINYKSFFLFTGFMYELGGELYNSTLVSKVENADIFYNVDSRVFTDRWQKPGDETYLKDIKDWDEPTRVTSRFVQKNNSLSLNSITLGYNVPKKVLEKYQVQTCKIQLTANDLAHFSTIKRERGTSYPYARTINLTVNLSF